MIWLKFNQVTLGNKKVQSIAKLIKMFPAYAIVNQHTAEGLVNIYLRGCSSLWLNGYYCYLLMENLICDSDSLSTTFNMYYMFYNIVISVMTFSILYPIYTCVQLSAILKLFKFLKLT